MFDFESRSIIESLRSGVPSITVGKYFSQARPTIMRAITSEIDDVVNNEKSSGMIISGKYGEGKTHLLQTIHNLAFNSNMVVSYVSLGKETPMDKLHVLYSKVINNTYLPNHKQPGFLHLLDERTANDPLIKDLLLYSSRSLETDKLYYLLRAYYSLENNDEKFLLKADLEGDYVSNAVLKRIYRENIREKVKYNIPFSKTKHIQDYFNFMSHLFKVLGYNGWIILFDETELIGRLSKKARIKAYNNMSFFLNPNKNLESTVSVFALSSSYVEDVIENKIEKANIEELEPELQKTPREIVNSLINAKELRPLTNEEIHFVFEKIVEFYKKAYEWDYDVPLFELESKAKNSAYLLRTRIRYAIEYLDQLYQYGDVVDSSISNLITKEDVSIEIPDE